MSSSLPRKPTASLNEKGSIHPKLTDTRGCLPREARSPPGGAPPPVLPQKPEEGTVSQVNTTPLKLATPGDLLIR